MPYGVAGRSGVSFYIYGVVTMRAFTPRNCRGASALPAYVCPFGRSLVYGASLACTSESTIGFPLRVDVKKITAAARFSNRFATVSIKQSVRQESFGQFLLSAPQLNSPEERHFRSESSRHFRPSCVRPAGATMKFGRV